MRESSLYLASDGHANAAAGNGRLDRLVARGATTDAFAYDPMDPLPARGGSICCTGNPKDQPGAFDHRDLDTRSDTLAYTSDALAAGLELTGPLRAEIYLSSDAKDTDVTSRCSTSSRTAVR